MSSVLDSVELKAIRPDLHTSYFIYYSTVLCSKVLNYIIFMQHNEAKCLFPVLKIPLKIFTWVLIRNFHKLVIKE